MIFEPNDRILAILDIAVFIWFAVFAGMALRRIASGIKDSVCFVILGAFALLAVPLFMDAIIGRPSYDLFPGFNIASNDLPTCIIYCLYIAFIPLILWRTGLSTDYQQTNSIESSENIVIRSILRHHWVLWIILVIPLIVALFAPDPSVYLKYGVVTEHSFSEASFNNYKLVAVVSVMSVFAGAMLLLLGRRQIIQRMCLVLPMVIADAWLNGKRNMVAMIAILLVYNLWNRGYAKGKYFYILLMTTLIGIMIFSFTYQAVVRDLGISTLTPYQLYTGYRIDYGRDDVIKLAMYSELHPDGLQILEYRGQSLLFLATILVPRTMWPDKPYPFAQYMTSTLFRTRPKLWGWGMTTSIFDESIANFGWFGLLIAPFFLAIICRVGDKSRDALVRLLTVFVGVMFLTVEAAAFYPILLIWCVLIVLAWRSSMRIKHNAVCAD